MENLTTLINDLNIHTTKKDEFIDKLSAKLLELKKSGKTLYNTTSKYPVEIDEVRLRDFCELVRQMYFGRGVGHLEIINKK